MHTINKSDLRKVTYAEFGDMLERQTEQIAAYCSLHSMHFDLVVPILRSGGFPGLHFAARLNIKNILPVQYKREFHPTEYNQKKFLLPELTYELPDTFNILITDTKTVYGGTAKKAIADVQGAYPKAILYFSSIDIDQALSYLEHVTHIFVGRYSNERRLLSNEEARKKDISQDILVFPWENLDEMWEELVASDKYNTRSSVRG